MVCRLLKQVVPQAGEPAEKPRELTRAEDLSDGGRQDTQPTKFIRKKIKRRLDYSHKDLGG